MKPTKMRNMQTFQATFTKRSKGVSCALSPNLREKYNLRNIRVVTGDGVTVVRGEYKQVQGKVSKVSTLDGRLAIEGIKKEKSKGAKFDVMIHASAVVITDLNTDDQWRMKKLKKGNDIIDDKDSTPKDSDVKPAPKTVESEPKTTKPKETKSTKPAPKTVESEPKTTKPKEIKSIKSTSKSTSKLKSQSIKKSTSNAENIKGKKSD